MEKHENLLLLFLSCGIPIAEPLTLKLEYKEAGEENYSEQIQEAFTKLIAKDAALAKEFTQFEAPPDSGRYFKVPTIIPIVISEEEHVDLRDTGEESEFQKTIAFYYRFEEGHHHGIATSSGFFALFTVTGKLTYRQLANNDFDLSAAERQPSHSPAFQGRETHSMLGTEKGVAARHANRPFPSGLVALSWRRVRASRCDAFAMRNATMLLPALKGRANQRVPLCGTRQQARCLCLKFGFELSG